MAIRHLSRSTVSVRLVTGSLLVGSIVMLAFLSLWWTPFDPLAINVAERLRAPSVFHPFGTDPYGRDLLSMVMTGARSALVVSFSSCAIGLGFGVPLGLLAGARKGWIDEVVARFCDVIFAFPAVLLAVLISAGFGGGERNAIIAIGLFYVPVFARIARNSARLHWSRDYVWAAMASGHGGLWISVRHILPNIAGLIATQATVQLSVAILADAALSFVGLGTQPPAPSWGRMLQEAQTMIGFAPWLVIFPGAAVVVSVLGLALLGDGLRDRRRTGREVEV
jgi:peptide/nickel transport system permease protein